MLLLLFMFSTFYIQGHENGENTSYHDNGQLKVRVQISYGKPYGKGTFYFKSGAVQGVQDFGPAQGAPLLTSTFSKSNQKQNNSKRTK